MSDKLTKVLKGGGKIHPPKPFIDNAFEYFKLNLSTIPCTFKTPLISWKKYQNKRPTKSEIQNWIKKYPNANIGIVTGKISNLTIIDCDNPLLKIEDLEAEFGESNFIVSSPSGGFHLYYQFSGESKKINFDGRKIDIISEGGFIIAPNSYNKNKKAFYSVLKGNFDDLNKLTHLNKKSIDVGQKTKVLSGFQVKNDLKIEEGQRNSYLFSELKKIAPSISNYSVLENKAFEINNFTFTKSLENYEVINTAKSIWNYKIKGCLINKGESGVFIKNEEIEKLAKEPRALQVLINLRRYHDGVNRYFCIDQEKTSKKFQMTRKTLRKQIEVLMKYGFLKRLETKKKKVVKDSKIKTLPYKYSLC